MYSPAGQSVAEFYKHQELLLPYTSPHLGATNLDVGCGTGLTSIIHEQKLGISPTLSDVVDSRHPIVQSLPFYLIQDEKLPFDDNSFDSSYIQYVTSPFANVIADCPAPFRGTQSFSPCNNRGRD
jgi:ubiquinone/menaquinone biosynthesis C-methylase UbiE